MPVLSSLVMTPCVIAIVPAAGMSRRMGQPKLLLDIAGQSVIARVIQTLRLAGVERTLVVVRSDDQALIHEATQAGAEVVLPAVDPQEMRESVECALRHLEGEIDSKQSNDATQEAIPCNGWLLVPADHPTLNPDVIRQLIVAWQEQPEKIAVPVCEGQRGHPTLFSWSLVGEVFSLPSDQGLNQLLRKNTERVLEVRVTDSQILNDLDTPDDLIRLRAEFGQA